MAKLSWGTEGKRYFEVGIDRGVLFVGNTPGVAWNGLVSVTESPSGGEPTPYYLDGLKFLNVASAEEYAATIQAFSSPDEFDVCDGTVSISSGLLVTNQPRKEFCLSYRTKLGNDIDGQNHGYKLHIVYNALASPSERANATIGDSTDPIELSWAITTTAPLISNYRPTAHIVIDSRTTSSNLLAMIEDNLYGSEYHDARMLYPDGLIGMFTGIIIN